MTAANLNLSTSLRSISNAYHVANALDKRGFTESAGFVRGFHDATKAATGGAFDHTFATLWQDIQAPTVLRDLFALLAGAADELPEDAKKHAAYLNEAATRRFQKDGSAARLVEAVKAEVPDVFEYFESQGVVEVKLTLAQARALFNSLETDARLAFKGARLAIGDALGEERASS